MEAIVAVYDDWGIGAAGTQPLTLRGDRRHFRDLTQGAAVIVGRRTLADFPGGKPLKHRVNILLSRRPGESDSGGPGLVTVSSPAEAAAEAERYARTYVIGGASVYRALFPQLHRVHVTKLAARPASDVFFPNLDRDPGWRCIDPGEPLEEDGIGYRFLTYERIPVREHVMHLDPGPYAQVRDGKKTIELRLNDEKRRMIAVGDLLRFLPAAGAGETEAEAGGKGNALRGVVTALHHYATFAELYRALPLTACGYTAEELRSSGAPPEDMERYYPLDAQRSWGVVGIGFRLEYEG